MNIVLFVNKDLEANIAFNLLKSELFKHETKIFYSDSVGRDHIKPKSLIQLEFFEKTFIFNEFSDFIETLEVKPSFELFDSNFRNIS